MRDENRIREKIELSLDSRQVVSLVVGGLLVLGVVFVLGVMFGKQLAPVTQPAQVDVLTKLDQAADAGKVPLTFQQELTAPAPKAPAVAQTKPAESKPAPKPSEQAKPSAVASAASSKDAGPSKPDAAQADPAPSPKMDKQLADAFSAAKANPLAAAVAMVPTSGFTVQVAASQQKDEASAVLQKLRSSGLRPYLIDADIPGKGHWYRVRLGSFKTKDDAEKYVRDLKRETGFTAFVTSAK